MRDPKPSERSNNSSFSNSKQKNGQDNICWRYNRNQCRSKHCRFEHKCSFCGLANHPQSACFKCKRESAEKDKNKTDSNKNSS